MRENKMGGFDENRQVEVLISRYPELECGEG